MVPELPGPEMVALTVRGQAMVLMIEAAQPQLCQLAGEVDPAMAAQVIVASQNALGPVGDVTVN